MSRRIFEDMRLWMLVALCLQASTSLINADVRTSCACAGPSNQASYQGYCASNDLFLVVIATYLGRTPDTSNAAFCSDAITTTSSACVVTDVASSWAVRTACNARTTQCNYQFAYDNDVINNVTSCAAMSGYTFACLQYDCVAKYNAEGIEGPYVFLSDGAPLQYLVSAQFQLMTSFYPSSTSTQSRTQCSISITAPTSVLLKLEDVRGRLLPSASSTTPCPYLLYVDGGGGNSGSSGALYRQWCATPEWTYDQMNFTATTNSTIDIVFYSNSPGLTEGAAWITVQANRTNLFVNCGSGIQLNSPPNETSFTSVSSTNPTTPVNNNRIDGPNPTATSAVYPSTTLSLALSTTSSVASTTTTLSNASPIIVVSHQSSNSSTFITLPSTAGNSPSVFPAGSSSTASTASSPISSTSTSASTASKAASSSVSITTSAVSITPSRSPAANPAQISSTTINSASSITPPSTAGNSPSVFPVGSSSTASRASAPAETPGVPVTPAASSSDGTTRVATPRPWLQQEAIDTADSTFDSFTKPVAITVTVVLGGLLIAVGIGALVYWRTKGNKRLGEGKEKETSFVNENPYEVTVEGKTKY